MDPPYFREDDGRGKDAIVFVHGGGLSGRMWRPALQALREYHCLAPDLPGHGHSAYIRPFALETGVEGLSDLIRTSVRSGRVALVGFSMGAIVCLELTKRYPDLVKKAFLSGTTPRFGRIAASMMNAVSRPFLALMGPERRVRFFARSVALTDDQIDIFRENVDRLPGDLVLQVNDVVAP